MVYIFIFMEVSSSSLATQDKNISSYLTSSNWEYEADSNDALKNIILSPHHSEACPTEELFISVSPCISS